MEWNPGYVVFATGDTVHCDVRYNASVPHGVLQLKRGDLLLTVVPGDAPSFGFYDRERNRTRRFLSLAADPNESYMTHEFSFMECLYLDEQFSIVNHRTVGLPYNYMNYTWFVSKPARLNRSYIFERSTGNLLPISRQNALRVLEEHHDEVKAYIESNRIRFKSLADYIKVFRFHNSL